MTNFGAGVQEEQFHKKKPAGALHHCFLTWGSRTPRGSLESFWGTTMQGRSRQKMKGGADWAMRGPVSIGPCRFLTKSSASNITLVSK